MSIPSEFFEAFEMMRAGQGYNPYIAAQTQQRAAVQGGPHFNHHPSMFYVQGMGGAMFGLPQSGYSSFP